MNFYNFEKYNDVFCFEKLSYDYQPLLKIYEGNYKTSLNTFLKEYEENTEFRYIESQLYICNKEITIQKSIITSLERLDHETFYYVRNRVDKKHSVYAKNQKDSFEVKQQTIQTTPENPNNDDSKELKAPTVIDYPNDDDDDDEVLDMHATAKNFIKFISNRITSLCLINKFLEQRKHELERESCFMPGTNTTDLGLEDIALKLVWEGANVTRANANVFLIGTELTSGDKLYNFFKFYRNSTDRRANPLGVVKLKNKIKRFEKVIKTLDDEFKQKAEDELKTLKRHLSKD